MSQENVELTYRAFDAFNRRDLGAYLALTDDDVVAVPRAAAMEGGYHGHDGIRRWWKNLLDVFPDFTIEVGKVRDLGDVTLAAVRLRGHGAGSDTPAEEKVWFVALWRRGKCIWWRTFSTWDEALESVGLLERPMSQESVEIVRSFSDAWQRGDLAAALSVLDDDVEWHDQAAIPGADVHRGREAVSHHFEQWLDAWEEIDYTIEELLDRGDRVVSVLRRRGKGKGSGVEVTDQVIHVFTVRSEKIVHFEGFSDKDEALAAAGLSE